MLMGIKAEKFHSCTIYIRIFFLKGRAEFTDRIILLTEIETRRKFLLESQFMS